MKGTLSENNSNSQKDELNAYACFVNEVESFCDKWIISTFEINY